VSDFEFISELSKLAKKHSEPKKDVKQMTYAELVAQLKKQGKIK
jgi:hypothetical protein